jgi:hypothetical protein
VDDVSFLNNLGNSPKRKRAGDWELAGSAGPGHTIWVDISLTGLSLSTQTQTICPASPQFPASFRFGELQAEDLITRATCVSPRIIKGAILPFFRCDA